MESRSRAASERTSKDEECERVTLLHRTGRRMGKGPSRFPMLVIVIRVFGSSKKDVPNTKEAQFLVGRVSL